MRYLAALPAVGLLATGFGVLSTVSLGAARQCVQPAADVVAAGGAGEVALRPGQVLTVVIPNGPAPLELPWLPPQSSDEAILYPVGACPAAQRVLRYAVWQFQAAAPGSATVEAGVNPDWTPLPPLRGIPAAGGPAPLSVLVRVLGPHRVRHWPGPAPPPGPPRPLYPRG